MSGWHPDEGGKLIGQMGCEGIVLRDEEHDDGACITLERCGDHCEIVCGDYGSMMHTGFAGLDDADAVYEAMRSELGELVSTERTREERLAFYESFTSKW